MVQTKVKKAVFSCGWIEVQRFCLQLKANPKEMLPLLINR